MWFYILIQGEQLALALDAVYISAGEVLQANIHRQTSGGTQSISYFNKAVLVPDEVISQLIMVRLKEQDVIERGYVLEGFPRTKRQAAILAKDGYFPIHFCFYFLM